MKKSKEYSGLKQSFFNAFRGIIWALRAERNLKIHFIIALMILISSFFLNLSRMEIIALVIAITGVLAAEMINTASENMTDLITEEHHPMARIVKDIMAGSVLMASLGAAVVGYLVFVRPEVLGVFKESVVMKKVSLFPPHIVFVALIIVFGVSAAIKVRRENNLTLVGGMPSIHTALAFSIALISYSLS